MRLWGHKSNLRLLVRRPGALLRAYRWPLAAMLAGAVLDGVTTYRAMALYGVSCELHPAVWLVAHVLGAHLGVPVAMVGKMACAVTVASLWRRWCPWILLLFGALSALGAASNHFQWP